MQLVNEQSCIWAQGSWPGFWEELLTTMLSSSVVLWDAIFRTKPVFWNSEEEKLVLLKFIFTSFPPPPPQAIFKSRNNLYWNECFALFLAFPQMCACVRWLFGYSRRLGGNLSLTLFTVRKKCCVLDGPRSSSGVTCEDWGYFICFASFSPAARLLKR